MSYVLVKSPFIAPLVICVVVNVVVLQTPVIIQNLKRSLSAGSSLGGLFTEQALWDSRQLQIIRA